MKCYGSCGEKMHGSVIFRHPVSVILWGSFLIWGCGLWAEKSESEPVSTYFESPAAPRDSQILEEGNLETLTAEEQPDLLAESAGRTSSSLQRQTSAAPYWPRFHGPNFDNISPDKGLLRSWPPQGPPLRWKASGIGEGYSSVTLADGRIFTAGNIGEKTFVTALSLSGKILWQAENGPAWTKSYPGTRGTPTVDGPRLYHLSPLGQLSCFQSATGKLLWTVNILQRFRSKYPTWALAESVLVDGNHVICCPGGPEVSVVALDKLTGKIVWTAPSTNDLAGYASPSIGTFGGRRIVFTMNAKAVIGVDASTGELLFRHEHITSWDVNVLTPIFRDGYLFICSGYGTGAKLLRLIPAGKKFDVEVLWAERTFDNHHGGVIYLDGYLYGSNHRGQWMCLNFATGEVMYRHSGVGKGSLTYADGMLYVLSERGVVGLVEASPRDHRVISQFRLPPDGTGPSWAHPVVIGGTLYIRHGDILYAYDVQEG